jgi:hypothetical protein
MQKLKLTWVLHLLLKGTQKEDILLGVHPGGVSSGSANN